MSRETLETLLKAYYQSGDSAPVHQYVASLLNKRSMNTDTSVRVEQLHSFYGGITDLEPTEDDFPIQDFEDLNTVDMSQAEIDSEQIRRHQHHLSDSSEEAIVDTPTEVLVNSEIPKNFGTYHTEGVLGEGGMGMVLRVRDGHLKRSVALKVMHDQFAHNPEKRNVFIEEAQISAQLQHPGILPVYDFSMLPGGMLYFTMKEVEGQTLRDVIKSVHNVSQHGVWRSTDDGWNLRRLMSAFHSVCETVAYAHSKGVVHRDLKPANIMVGEYGEVWVVDWGIATTVDMQDGVETSSMPERVSDNSIVGSPSYMSPEQAWGRQVDGRSDVYSLGVILYRILMGKSPYSGTSVMEIVESKRQEHTISLRTMHTDPQHRAHQEQQAFQHSFNAKFTAITADGGQRLQEDPALPLPNELVDICEQAVQYHERNRFQTARELAHAVQSWLDGAQRREKALAILDQVNTLEQDMKLRIAAAQRSWMEANKTFSAEGIGSETGWKQYEASQVARESHREIQYEIQQHLQGAIVYDPELIEVHRRIVEIEYRGLLEALLHIDKRREQSVARKIRIHLDRLPKREQDYWQRKRDKDVGALHLLRKRRGTFVGRRQHLSQLESQLQSGTIISLIGTAGVGKTHLALEAASIWRHTYESETIFCDLTPATDRLGVLQEIAKSLQLSLGQNPMDSIVGALKSRSALLMIWDNVEQVVDVARDILESIFGRIDTLTVLVTSRIKLGVECERIIRLDPMSLLESVELFVLRAQQVQPEFALTSGNKESIGRIVEGLDRLPLAIELAAARISMLTIEQIESRLSERFDLLRGRLRDPKQLALQGALDWSWSLLSEIGQSVLMQCSVFQAGFDLLAAEGVIDLSNFEHAPGIIDVVEALYDDNLLLKTQQEDGTFRYGMLVSIHAYAEQKRDEHQDSTEVLGSVYSRHAKYYADLSFQMRDNPTTFSHMIALELENCIVGIEHGTNQTSFLCCQAAMRYFHFNGPMTRGIEVSTVYLNRVGLTDDLRIPIVLDRISCLRVSGAVKQAKEELKAAIQISEESLPVAPVVDEPSTDGPGIRPETIAPCAMQHQVVHWMPDRRKSSGSLCAIVSEG